MKWDGIYHVVCWDIWVFLWVGEIPQHFYFKNNLSNYIQSYHISMTDQALQSFADHYTAADFGAIRYDWNGKYGIDFHDTNYEFRIQLSQHLLPQINSASIELIRDLYAETTKASAATFSIYSNIQYFAQELLRRDWRRYLIDYMQGGSYGMDSYLAIGRIEIKKEVAQEIVTYITATLQTTTNANEKWLMEGFLERFQWFAGKI